MNINLSAQASLRSNAQLSNQSFPRLLPVILIVLSVMLLGGCQREDTLSYRYKDYLDRVSNILDMEPEKVSSLPAIAYPDRRSRLIEIPGFEQGLVEVWDFQRCGLMSLINQKNSNLGKVMAPSQRFIYEQAFWQKLEPCYQKREQWLAEDSDFVERLESVYQHKQQIRPLVSHQLFFAGDELTHQLSQSQQAFLPDARPEYRGVAAALKQLAEVADNPQPNNTLEQQLQVLNSQPILHSLLKSLQVSTHSLNRVSQLMETKLDQRPVCLNGGSTQRSKNLYNVLQKYYLQGIQPVIAHHSRMANQLLPPMNQIFDITLNNLPAEYATTELKSYQNRWLSMENPEGLWQSFQQANQRHTAVWNRLLRQCGLFPQKG